MERYVEGIELCAPCDKAKPQSSRDENSADSTLNMSLLSAAQHRASASALFLKTFLCWLRMGLARNEIE